MNGFPRIFTLLLLGVLQTVAAPPQRDSNKKEKTTPTADPTSFGFTGPETYPIDPFISQLRSADLDGDGLNDLIIVNNSRSKITLLYNQTGKTNNSQARATVKPDINELPPDARFRIDSIASEKRIAV